MSEQLVSVRNRYGQDLVSERFETVVERQREKRWPSRIVDSCLILSGAVVTLGEGSSDNLPARMAGTGMVLVGLWRSLERSSKNMEDSDTLIAARKAEVLAEVVPDIGDIEHARPALEAMNNAIWTLPANLTGGEVLALSRAADNVVYKFAEPKWAMVRDFYEEGVGAMVASLVRSGYTGDQVASVMDEFIPVSSEDTLVPASNDGYKSWRTYFDMLDQNPAMTAIIFDNTTYVGW